MSSSRSAQLSKHHEPFVVSFRFFSFRWSICTAIEKSITRSNGGFRAKDRNRVPALSNQYANGDHSTFFNPQKGNLPAFYFPCTPFLYSHARFYALADGFPPGTSHFSPRQCSRRHRCAPSRLHCHLSARRRWAIAKKRREKGEEEESHSRRRLGQDFYAFWGYLLLNWIFFTGIFFFSIWLQSLLLIHSNQFLFPSLDHAGNFFSKASDCRAKILGFSFKSREDLLWLFCLNAFSF